MAGVRAVRTRCSMPEDQQCPACGTCDISVVGLEDGRLRVRCDTCLHDYLAETGPDLKPCNEDCGAWVQEGIKVCGNCARMGAPL